MTEETNLNQEAQDLARQSFIEEFQNIQIDLQNALVTIPNEDKPRIDEVMFREVFLPYFAGDKEKVYPNVNMNHWQAICGNLMRPVTIVNRQGEDILTVPPVYDRSILQIADPLGNKEDDDRPRINHVWRTVSLLRQHSGKQAEEYFANMISGRLIKEGVEVAIVRHAESWNKIYEYYGREIPYPKMREWFNALDGGHPINTDTEKKADDRIDPRLITDSDGVEYELV